MQRGRGKILAYASKVVMSNGVATHFIFAERFSAVTGRLVHAAKANNRHELWVTVE